MIAAGPQRSRRNRQPGATHLHAYQELKYEKEEQASPSWVPYESYSIYLAYDCFLNKNCTLSNTRRSYQKTRRLSCKREVFLPAPVESRRAGKPGIPISQSSEERSRGTFQSSVLTFGRHVGYSICPHVLLHKRVSGRSERRGHDISITI